jgi:hypothetical protein
MKRVIVLIAVIIVLSSCSDADGTKVFLQEQGYTEIETTGYDLWADGKDDWTTTGFVATSPNGERIRGAVSDKGPLCFFRPRMNIRVWGKE